MKALKQVSHLFSTSLLIIRYVFLQLKEMFPRMSFGHFEHFWNFATQLDVMSLLKKPLWNLMMHLVDFTTIEQSSQNLAPAKDLPFQDNIHLSTIPHLFEQLVLQMVFVLP